MNIIFLLIALLAVPFLLKAFRSFASKGKYTNVNANEFAEKMKQPNTVVLDVRMPQEIAQGKIKGAREMNVMSADFAQKIQSLDKDKTYLVYCRSGSRSSRACSIMAQQGFTHLNNLTGGYSAWGSRK